MGVVTGYSACIACRRPFTYNPMRVPSVVIDGTREPICLDCVTRANPLRAAKGLPPIVPLTGAYDPVDEADLEL